MAGTHLHALYHHGATPLHHAAPQVKIAAAVGFVFAVVLTPREAIWAFALYTAMLVCAAIVARLPFAFIMTRMAIEIPFLLVAVLLPLLGPYPSITVLGIELSQPGLWDAWNIVAKASLGLGTAVVLGATTEISEMLEGLDGLRVPSVITAIAGFMVRYVDVVLGDWARMRVAMAARGHDPRWITQIGPYARTLGVVFIRTFERGERVYLAMASRGYDGSMPTSALPATPPRQWATVGVVVLVAWMVMAAAWGLS